MPDTPPSPETRTAVDKALSLLGVFGRDADSGVGVSELARRADLSKSTAFRLLADLERNGAVEKAGSVYRIGPLINDLAAPVTDPATERVRELLTPFLIHLFEKTRQTVHLAVLEGDQVVYLNKLHGMHGVPAPSRIGGRVPAHCTAVGKALLAHAPETAEKVLGADLPRWTPRTVVDPADLRRQLAEVRRTGVAFDHEEIRRGLNCVAGPVLTSRGNAVAALSVTGAVGVFEPWTQANTIRAVTVQAARVVEQAGL